MAVCSVYVGNRLPPGITSRTLGEVHDDVRVGGGKDTGTFILLVGMQWVPSSSKSESKDDMIFVEWERV